MGGYPQITQITPMTNSANSSRISTSTVSGRRSSVVVVRPKTTGQVRAIFGEARRCGLDNEALHEVVASVLLATQRGSGPTVREGVTVADGALADTRATAPSIAALTYAQAERVIQRLKGRQFVPRRTLQYRRKKQGVQQIVSLDQVLLIAALATQRKWSAGSLVKFCKRQCGHHPLRTTADANKVIEALKDMNRRDGLWWGNVAA
jgi:hypothetical protein